MTNKITDRDQEKDNNEKPALKPDPETLHTTDPQENMEGPVSSIIRKTGDAFETDETKREANKKKDKKM